MSSVRGLEETEILKGNLESQIERLIEQLQDLDTEREMFTPEEIQEMREDTIEEMKEMELNLETLMSGNMTLMSELSTLRLTMQLTVSEAFKTPEVIKMFAKQDNGQLRNKLESLKVDVKLGKVTKEAYNAQAVEILSALKKLGDKLSEREENFLSTKMTPSLAEFESNENNTLTGQASESVLRVAAKNIKHAKE
eukprot:TRINITY_DN12265_c0_g1_i1.p1 TRINITY_DN12265_c0_g1~~TRINITY_DN12265_c0_g1_i1.p1  ORF type:complete len:195 (+),score=56.54 TRINITY_DN12265_c0_g1_i1:242-826(+)